MIITRNQISESIKVFFCRSSSGESLLDHHHHHQVSFRSANEISALQTFEATRFPWSIFGTPSIETWRHQKSILESTFQSRKLKFIFASLNVLIAELMDYIGSVGKCQLDSLTMSSLLYSHLQLFIGLDWPEYRQFINHNAVALIAECRRVERSAARFRHYPLFAWMVANWPLFGGTSLLQTLITDAIHHRQCNRLESGKKSVKFRDEIFNSLLLEDRPPPSTGGRVKSSLKQTNPPCLSFIDILIDYEIEPANKAQGKHSRVPN